MKYMINGVSLSYFDFCKSLAQDTAIFIGENLGTSQKQLNKKEYLSAMQALDGLGQIKAGKESCTPNCYEIIQ